MQTWWVDEEKVELEQKKPTYPQSFLFASLRREIYYSFALVAQKADAPSKTEQEYPLDFKDVVLEELHNGLLSVWGVYRI